MANFRFKKGGQKHPPFYFQFFKTRDTQLDFKHPAEI
jgi:hypothetical protein